MRRHTRGQLLLSVCLLLGQGAPARATTAGDDSLTWREPSGGALLVRENGTLVPWCSGVLIGCQTFLTAAHCLCGRDVTGATCEASGLAVAADPVVFLQHGGFFRAATVHIHPDYDFPAADLAVIGLDLAVAGVAPAAIAAETPTPGSAATVVGFGRSGGLLPDAGLKRATPVATAACPESYPEESLCWTFTGTAPRSCENNDGAPLFLEGAGGAVVGGIGLGFARHSPIRRPPPLCIVAGPGLDADLAVHFPWILAAGGSDLDARRCGDLPQVGEPGVSVTSIAGRLGPTHASADHTFQITPATRLLRIALNAQDTAPAAGPAPEPNDVDLYVRRRGSTRLEDSCAATGADAYAACEFPAPAAGRWDVRVERISGAGDFQLTATAFGGDLPSCGNGVREVGEHCDGQEAEPCPAGCTARCACVTCREGHVEFGEVQFTRRFFLKGILREPESDDAPLDPRAHGFLLTVADDHGALVRIVIPPGDPGWSTSHRRIERYRWNGYYQGIRRIVLRQRPEHPREWRVVVDGHHVLGADVLAFEGLEVKIAIGEACVVKSIP